MATSKRKISAESLHQILSSKKEYSLIDVREQEEFSREHLLMACCIPLSYLEFKIASLVPCNNTPIYLMDNGEEDGLCRVKKAEAVLKNLGYRNIAVLDGGLKSWKDESLVTVKGIGSLSKGFGEYIEETEKTPSLSPQEIKAILDDHDSSSIVIDVRPANEYHNMNIPGSFNLPGCEVAYRVQELVHSPKTIIIINCAGRTRSIIGTQTLINLGLENKIFALRGGTMNWQLASYRLDYGSEFKIPELSPEGKTIAYERINTLVNKYGVRFITSETLEKWKDEKDDKTLYVFDIRQPDEYFEGHIEGAISAQGGQLVQATDEYAGVRNGRFVLVDNDERRAIVTAHWLIQMGFPNVFVLKQDHQQLPMTKSLPAKNSKTDSVIKEALEKGGIDAKAVAELKGSGSDILILDIGSSKLHRERHIPGAKWIMRSYMPRAFEKFPHCKNVIITSDSGEHAALGAEDARKLWKDARVYFLNGGTEAYKSCGYTMESGMQCPLCPEDDIWYRPYTDINASPEAMKGYFDWEAGLVSKIREDNCVSFTTPSTVTGKF